MARDPNFGLIDPVTGKVMSEASMTEAEMELSQWHYNQMLNGEPGKSCRMNNSYPAIKSIHRFFSRSNNSERLRTDGCCRCCDGWSQRCSKWSLIIRSCCDQCNFGTRFNADNNCQARLWSTLCNVSYNSRVNSFGRFWISRKDS